MTVCLQYRLRRDDEFCHPRFSCLCLFYPQVSRPYPPVVAAAAAAVAAAVAAAIAAAAVVAAIPVALALCVYRPVCSEADPKFSEIGTRFC